jgi:hypothetical protein
VSPPPRPPEETLPLVTCMPEAERYGIEAVRYGHQQGEVITVARMKEIVRPYIERGAAGNRARGMMVESNRLSNLMLNLGRHGPGILDGDLW